MKTQEKQPIAIYCVNYNSYACLANYLISIDKAALAAKEKTNVSVFVADNSVPSLPLDYKPNNFELKVMATNENLGYFGAVTFLMKNVSPLDFDYSIISNVDVVLEENFFSTLAIRQTSQDVGWIAPQIYSYAEKRDRNPKIMRRYSKYKLQILKALFAIPPLYNLYSHTAYKSKQIARHQPGEIYAGHGSFIILTHNYFAKCGIINYPMFLFCEEIYLGEQNRLNNLKVDYSPELIVYDTEHASTGTFRRKKYCMYNYEAIYYILKTYYQ